jgi:hypothetical protein
LERYGPRIHDGSRQSDRPTRPLPRLCHQGPGEGATGRAIHRRRGVVKPTFVLPERVTGSAWCHIEVVCVSALYAHRQVRRSGRRMKDTSGAWPPPLPYLHLPPRCGNRDRDVARRPRRRRNAEREGPRVATSPADGERSVRCRYFPFGPRQRTRVWFHRPSGKPRSGRGSSEDVRRKGGGCAARPPVGQTRGPAETG